ncbi:MAG: hypothetical protein JRG94_07840 [Deltaproteobacteria bacterium]|nr:hypothetical protein [Deltaproteobacteria bacterium]
MASFSEPGPPGTPAAVGLDASLDAAGLNVAAVLSRERYDALVPHAWQSRALLPGATSVFVIGSGGPAFYWAARRARPDAQHPLDEFLEEMVTRAASKLERAGCVTRAVFYWERRGENDREPGRFADFIALARAAGLGGALVRDSRTAPQRVPISGQHRNGCAIRPLCVVFGSVCRGLPGRCSRSRAIFR